MLLVLDIGAAVSEYCPGSPHAPLANYQFNGDLTDATSNHADMTVAQPSNKQSYVADLHGSSASALRMTGVGAQVGLNGGGAGTPAVLHEGMVGATISFWARYISTTYQHLEVIMSIGNWGTLDGPDRVNIWTDGYEYAGLGSPD